MQGHVAPFQRRNVSFVRRETRLGPQSQRTWDEHQGTLVIDVPRARASMSVAAGFELDAVRDFGRVAPLVVEIGSGTGDAVVHGAISRPGTNFLAVEVYGTGLAATLSKVVHHDLSNVRLVHADGNQVLEHMLRPHSVAELWIFFADPWPKVRHHKRRLVNPAFAELAASRLAAGAKLRLATDCADYAAQMRDVLCACGSLTNLHGGELRTAQTSRTGFASDPGGGFAPRFEGRAMTRFEEKALSSGQRIYDLELQRV
jgi:tRNA (guanine-N7-)-methyltransferase